MARSKSSKPASAAKPGRRDLFEFWTFACNKLRLIDRLAADAHGRAHGLGKALSTQIRIEAAQLQDAIESLNREGRFDRAQFLRAQRAKAKKAGESARDEAQRKRASLDEILAGYVQRNERPPADALAGEYDVDRATVYRRYNAMLKPNQQNVAGPLGCATDTVSDPDRQQRERDQHGNNRSNRRGTGRRRGKGAKGA